MDHFNELLFNAWFSVFVSVSQLKHTFAGSALETLMSRGAVTMTPDVIGIATETIYGNSCHRYPGYQQNTTSVYRLKVSPVSVIAPMVGYYRF